VAKVGAPLAESESTPFVHERVEFQPTRSLSRPSDEQPNTLPEVQALPTDILQSIAAMSASEPPVSMAPPTSSSITTLYSAAAADPDALFSIDLTIQSATGIRSPKHGKPYVIVYASSAMYQQTAPILFSRSPPAGCTQSTPAECSCAWDHSLHVSAMWPTDYVFFEIRDWVDGLRDKILGQTDFLTFPYRTADVAHERLSYTKELPLFVQSKKTRQKLLSGTLFISFTTGPAELDRSLAPLSPAAAIVSQVPNFDLHTQAYGVSIPNFRDVGGWPVSFRRHQTGQLVHGRMRAKVIFRTSAIHRATEHDSFLIVQDLRIKNLLDLRTPGM
jgi:hypothetical protein